MQLREIEEIILDVDNNIVQLRYLRLPNYKKGGHLFRMEIIRIKRKQTRLVYSQEKSYS